MLYGINHTACFYCSSATTVFLLTKYNAIAYVYVYICAILQVPVPAMNIVIMIVGTRGDVQPFFGLGRLVHLHRLLCCYWLMNECTHIVDGCQACVSNVQLDCQSQFCEAAVHSRLNEPSYRLLFVLTGHKLVEDGHRVRFATHTVSRC
jgi:hypothetical protein